MKDDTVVDKRDNNSKGITSINLVILILNVAGIILLPVVIIIARALFFKSCGSQAVSLPGITAIFFSVPVPVYFLLCTVVAVSLLVKEFLISDKKAKLIINMAAAIVASIFVLVLAIAFIVAFMGLFTSVSSRL